MNRWMSKIRLSGYRIPLPHGGREFIVTDQIDVSEEAPSAANTVISPPGNTKDMIICYWYPYLLLFAVGINTALRISDLLELRLEDFFDKNNKIKKRFWIKEKKRGKRHEVVFTNSIRCWRTLRQFRCISRHLQRGQRWVSNGCKGSIRNRGDWTTQEYVRGTGYQKQVKAGRRPYCSWALCGMVADHPRIIPSQTYQVLFDFPHSYPIILRFTNDRLQVLLFADLLHQNLGWIASQYYGARVLPWSIE